MGNDFGKYQTFTKEQHDKSIHNKFFPIGTPTHIQVTDEPYSHTLFSDWNRCSPLKVSNDNRPRPTLCNIDKMNPMINLARNLIAITCHEIHVPLVICHSWRPSKISPTLSRLPPCVLHRIEAATFLSISFSYTKAAQVAKIKSTRNTVPVTSKKKSGDLERSQVMCSGGEDGNVC